MKKYIIIFVYALAFIVCIFPSYYEGVTKKVASEIKEGDILLLDYWGVEAEGLYRFEVLAVMDGKIYSKKIQFFSGWLGTPESKTNFDSYNTVKKVPIIWDIKNFLTPVAPLLLGVAIGLLILICVFWDTKK